MTNAKTHDACDCRTDTAASGDRLRYRARGVPDMSAAKRIDCSGCGGVAAQPRQHRRRGSRVREVVKSARRGKNSDTASLTKLFADVQKIFGAVDVPIYNTAFMSGGRASEISAAEALDNFRIDVAGAIHCVNQILPRQIERGDGAIIFTGGLFGVHPNANFDYACMSMNRAALRALANT